MSLLGASCSAQTPQVEMPKFAEQAQRCCSVIESRYRPNFELMESLSHTSERRSASFASFNNDKESAKTFPSAETPPASSVESIIDLLLKIRTILVNANEVVNIAHTVVDNIDGLVKKLKLLRTAICDYFYPAQPAKKLVMLMLPTVKDPLSL